MPKLSYRPPSPSLTFLSLMAGFALLTAMLQPSWDKARRQALYTECLTNLDLLADHQARRIEETGSYLGCESWPEELPSVDAPWFVSDDRAPSCWEQLGFEPSIPLRGQYEVDRQAGGFEATCRMDLDGDGDALVFVTSQNLTAHWDSSSED